MKKVILSLVVASALIACSTEGTKEEVKADSTATATATVVPVDTTKAANCCDSAAKVETPVAPVK